MAANFSFVGPSAQEIEKSKQLVSGTATGSKVEQNPEQTIKPYFCLDVKMDKSPFVKIVNKLLINANTNIPVA